MSSRTFAVQSFTYITQPISNLDKKHQKLINEGLLECKSGCAHSIRYFFKYYFASVGSSKLKLRRLSTETVKHLVLGSSVRPGLVQGKPLSSCVSCLVLVSRQQNAPMT